jgi:Zn-dependent peptidase ImmA (M78 family)
MLQWDFYRPTDLEKEVTAMYQSFGIEEPSDLEEELIATRLGIKLFYVAIPSQAYENGKFRCIAVDKRLTRELQREHFFHELGHLLRGHAGNQTNLPELFRDLQEEQADHFLIYAAMPAYMIQQITMPEYEREVPYVLASEFKVTLKLAKERWEQIKRRIALGRWENACIEYERNRYRKSDPANWCDEAKKLFRTAIMRKMQKGQGVVIR